MDYTEIVREILITIFIICMDAFIFMLIKWSISTLVEALLESGKENMDE